MQETQAEIKNLKKRVHDLEDELSRKKTTESMSSSAEKVSDSLNEAYRQARLENAKVFRGMAESTVESISGTANAMTKFIEGVSQRDRLRAGATAKELRTHFFEDVADGIANAMSAAVDSQKKVVDKFYGAYQEADAQPDPDVATTEKG